MFRAYAFLVAGISLLTLSCFAESLSDLDRKMLENLEGKRTSQIASSPFSRTAATSSEMTLEELKLLGVAHNPSETYALISGKTVKEGDKIAGYKVVEVGRDYVLLKRLDETFVLNFQGGL